jgi:hypothetical protein
MPPVDDYVHFSTAAGGLPRRLNWARGTPRLYLGLRFDIRNENSPHLNYHDHGLGYFTPHVYADPRLWYPALVNGLIVTPVTTVPFNAVVELQLIILGDLTVDDCLDVFFTHNDVYWNDDVTFSILSSGDNGPNSPGGSVFPLLSSFMSLKLHFIAVELPSAEEPAYLTSA